ncbi:signal peptide peptidase SppA [Anaerolineae bacterium CFX9]|nr:signal peptide peptidase SppA [Anaerolineae bacterium CFX9]
MIDQHARFLYYCNLKSGVQKVMVLGQPLRKTVHSLRRFLRRLLRAVNPLRFLGQGIFALRNRLRRRFPIDYVWLTLQGMLPPLPEKRNWFLRRFQGAPPISLWELERAFRRLAADPRPQGIILNLRGVEMPLTDIHTLREQIRTLRAAGKRVIAYAQNYDMRTYFLASACDQILMQPGGEVATTGLRQQAIFLKDALAMIGVSFDVVAISPYKGALDSLSRSEISPEGREQLEWLLDARYEYLIREIAAGRRQSPEAMRMMIDSAPHTEITAAQAGYIDGVLYEEALPDHLNARHLVPWKRAQRILLREPEKRPSTEKYVAVLPITGTMMPGESGSPPVDLPVPLPIVGDDRAGDLTIVQQVRHLLDDEDAAAVVLFIDSGGGAVITAEAITSALTTLAETRPVVACMNAVAGSGGYEVAMPAEWIVAQPATITGSIGVVTAKIVTGGLRDRFGVQTVEFTRGANADLFSEGKPFTEEQRALMRDQIEHFYRQFLEKVAQSRRMSVEAVDAVGGGRVWTGEQALERGLIDAIGGLKEAIAKARALASLPDDARTVLVETGGAWLPPKRRDASAALVYALENTRALTAGAQVLMPFWIE